MTSGMNTLLVESITHHTVSVGIGVGDQNQNTVGDKYTGQILNPLFSPQSGMQMLTGFPSQRFGNLDWCGSIHY